MGLARHLLKPVDGASLGVFRIAFGLIMLWQCYRYRSYDWIGQFYADDPFLFKYYGFSWVHPPPGEGIYLVFWGLAAASLLVALGLFYRLAIVALFTLFTYIFLLDAARYLNHFYLVALLALVMCFVSAHGNYSLDRLRGRLGSYVPQWQLWSLLATIEIMLLYAGLVKINSDWLDALPLSMWLPARSDLPLIGPLLTWPATAHAASYGSIVLHLVGAPLLLFKRTRVPAFVTYAAFHLLNSLFFNIGIFPILTLVATTLFFSPSWPRAFTQPAESLRLKNFPLTRGTKVVWAWVGLFLLVQVLAPLRHFAYPRDVMWTDEGHRFAWRMKLREKIGLAVFYVRDPASGRTWTVDNATYLKPRQIDKVGTRPDLALQFAHHIAAIWRREFNVEEPDVRAWIACELNGRPAGLLVDPGVNLAKIERSLWPAVWITDSPTALPADDWQRSRRP